MLPNRWGCLPRLWYSSLLVFRWKKIRFPGHLHIHPVKNLQDQRYWPGCIFCQRGEREVGPNDWAKSCICCPAHHSSSLWAHLNREIQNLRSPSKKLHILGAWKPFRLKWDKRFNLCHPFRSTEFITPSHWTLMTEKCKFLKKVHVLSLQRNLDCVSHMT